MIIFASHSFCIVRYTFFALEREKMCGVFFTGGVGEERDVISNHNINYGGNFCSTNHPLPPVFQITGCKHKPPPLFSKPILSTFAQIMDSFYISPMEIGCGRVRTGKTICTHTMFTLYWAGKSVAITLPYATLRTRFGHDN